MELFVPIRSTRRRKKRRRRLRRVFFLLLLIAVAVTGALIFRYRVAHKHTGNDDLLEAGQYEERSAITLPRHYRLGDHDENYTRYATYFNDEQDVQIEAAEKMGVTPGTPLNSGQYVKLHNTSKYYLHDVSFPYLTPLAADLLAKIGELYQSEIGDTGSRLRVTSCLRTPDAVKKLRRRNVNAVENSCHLYGTTFDISYSRMEPEEKKALAKVLSRLRESGYCYVKHERKQPCFHITIRK